MIDLSVGIKMSGTDIYHNSQASLHDYSLILLYIIWFWVRGINNSNNFPREKRKEGRDKVEALIEETMTPGKCSAIMHNECKNQTCFPARCCFYYLTKF